MALLTLALLIDRLVGDPDWLWRRFPHPVVWFGWIINGFDKWRARKSRPRRDFVLGSLLLVAFGALALVFIPTLNRLPSEIAAGVELFLLITLIAQKSLSDHVRRVADALDQSLAEGRKAVGMIVGRDVTMTDESGIARAAIESLAENTSDGVVAPVFWYAVGGLPGLVFYKMINTADSMVGHRTHAHEWFGKLVARVDDFMNWVPARLTAVLVWIVSFSSGPKGRKFWLVVRRNAPKHRSPNAGWPEAAFAVMLGMALGGPRRYGNEEVDGVWLNPDGDKALDSGSIRRALILYWRLCNLLIALVGLATLVAFLNG
jgi:adenosylcobinamide-phosphate synthase